MADVYTVFPEPQTIEQAKRMTAAAILMAIGGSDAFDIVYRHRIKEVSTRQIAKDNRCKRNKVRRIVAQFDEAMRVLSAACEGEVAPSV